MLHILEAGSFRRIVNERFTCRQCNALGVAKDVEDDENRSIYVIAARPKDKSEREGNIDG